MSNDSNEMIGREATCKEKVIDCNHLGNAAAMRKALETINRIDTRRLKCLLYELVEADILDGGEINKTISTVEKARQALSAPPRNCDIMDWRTAWAKWRTECHPQKPCGYAEVVSGTEQFMDWYMSEAKGGAK